MANPTGNIADFINNWFGENCTVINLISSAFGAGADVSGFLALFGVGGDKTEAELKNILNTIQNDFAQLNAADKAARIIQRLQNLDNITSPAQTQLEQLQAHKAADIQPCLNAINALAINPDATSNWEVVFSDQIFWTDAGQYFQFKNIQVDPLVGPQLVNALDAGYGLQTPAQDGGEDLAFSYLYVLPDFLRVLAIFIAVAGSEDPNWVADYGPQVLGPVAAFLKNNVHDTIANEITFLSPDFWDGQTLWNAIGVSPLNGPSTPNGKWPWPGVSAIPAVPRSVYPIVDPPGSLPTIPTATGANIEFGAVEKYSGYSSMANYQIVFHEIGSAWTDNSMFNKFQIRLLKRAIDVYIGVGLPQIWNVINSLNALVGAPPAPPHPLSRWSFREIFYVSALPADPTTNKLSFYSLSHFIYNTQPLDTDQTTTFWSFRELLSH
jgi:hypothetical protein